MVNGVAAAAFLYGHLGAAMDSLTALQVLRMVLALIATMTMLYAGLASGR